MSAVVPGLVASVRGGWRLLTEDPFAVLAPTAALLLVDVGLAVLARRAAGGPLDLALAGLALFALRPLLHAPFVARLVATAARLAGRRSWPWGRPVALLGAELVMTPVTAAVFAAPTAVGAAAASFAAGEGWVAVGAVALAAGAVVGSTLALAARAVFARVPWAIAVEGRSAAAAVGSAVRAPGHAPAAFALLLASDVLLGASALACGALVLPGYPLVWLALAHRWAHESEAP